MNFSLNLLGSELWGEIVNSLQNLWQSTGLYDLVSNFTAGGWQNLVMIAIACVLVYLAVVKKFEPLLLLPIAFGMFIVNIPGAYRILFGTKGYIITEVYQNVATGAITTGSEIARGTLAELCARFGSDVISVEGLTSILAGQQIANGEYIVTLSLSSETVIRDFAESQT